MKGSPAGPVLIVGAGLIGTSIGLALRRRDVDVHLRDRSEAVARLAASMGAGVATAPARSPVLVVVAVPPDHLGATVAEVLQKWPDACVTDVGSVKVKPLEDAAALGADLRRYVGGHPMAGSERSGPLAASADLFDGRAWAVTAHPTADPAGVAAVKELVEACGAVLVRMGPQEHDEAVARISHLPHVLAVLAAARLESAPEQHLRLAGPGLRDVTRVAGGDPGLWRQILTANHEALARLLLDVRADLDTLIDELTAPSVQGGTGDTANGVETLLRRGARGTRAIPGKHGAPRPSDARLLVQVPDRPGELARLFADAGTAGVNIEDIHIDHDPGRPAGLVELTVRADAVDRLGAMLADRGWALHR